MKIVITEFMDERAVAQLRAAKHDVLYDPKLVDDAARLHAEAAHEHRARDAGQQREHERHVEQCWRVRRPSQQQQHGHCAGASQLRREHAVAVGRAALHAYQAQGNRRQHRGGGDPQCDSHPLRHR